MGAPREISIEGGGGVLLLEGELQKIFLMGGCLKGSLNIQRDYVLV